MKGKRSTSWNHNRLLKYSRSKAFCTYFNLIFFFSLSFLVNNTQKNNAIYCFFFVATKRRKNSSQSEENSKRIYLISFRKKVVAMFANWIEIKYSELKTWRAAEGVAIGIDNRKQNKAANGKKWTRQQKLMHLCFYVAKCKNIERTNFYVSLADPNC